MRQRVLALLMAAAALGLLPSGARATDWTGKYYSYNGACVGSFSLCFNFTLAGGQNNLWKLTVAYLSTSQGGTLTGVGIYGMPLLTDFTGGTNAGRGSFTGYQGGDPACSNLAGPVQACAESYPPPTTNTLVPGQALVFNFYSSTNVGYAMNPTGFKPYISGEVRDFVNAGCTIKFGTWVPGNLTSVDGVANNACDAGGITTPEPISIVLLASGLGGLAMPAWRRRRRKVAVEE